MKPLQRHLLLFWPIGLLVLLEGILVGANYIPGTWLMGWDNVMPELDFRQALVTNLFGVWQEHRGGGLYDGMGHAANLVHTLFLWLLSLALPASVLRYAFHFLMHLLGGVGMYILLSRVIPAPLAVIPAKAGIQNHFKLDPRSCPEDDNKPRFSLMQWIALLGAIFYLFNLATIQMFYTPLEAFSVHFAALPWLAWSLLVFLKEGSRKRLLIFLLISLLSTPQFFIPTLLLPVGILLGSITIITVIKNISVITIRRCIKAAGSFFLINAFWLLPYVWGLPRNAPVIQAAKINQMSSEEVFARSQAFGGLGDVLRMRGFPLDFEDIDADGRTTFLMAPWREFLEKPLVVAGSWILVTVVMLGLLASIGVKKLAAAKLLTPMEYKEAVSFAVTFILALFFLANDTPIIKGFMDLLRETIPWFAEAYRFPFTKFSLLFGLSASILIAVGVARIMHLVGKLHQRAALTVATTITAVILLLAYPAFRGHFFSDRLRVRLPNDYPRLFAFMNDKPPGRIAYLPQHQFWSWKYYDWGYRGSGFLWYGTQQPILDRAFDPWSNENENYYWEISRSIYSKDVAAFDAVLAKYDVHYILFDKNIISPSHNRALFTEEIKEMLAGLPEVREVARFGKITVYERKMGGFVRLAGALPTVSPAYGWTDNDVAYRVVGDYITNEIASPRQLAGSRNDTWIYPFRSLFTKRSVDEREFTITETSDVITVGSLVEATAASILKDDALLYDSTRMADLVPENVKPCGILGESTSEVGASFTSEVKPFLRFTSNGQRGCLRFGLGSLPHRDGYLVAVESRHVTGRPLLFSLINQTAKHIELESYLPTTYNLQPTTSYFILPALAPDGLGYSAYVSNDAIGRQETVNDLGRIRVYRLPYEEMVSVSSREIASPSARNDILAVDHPNPAYYHIEIPHTLYPIPYTLILSQSFDPGWTAWEKIPTFPYFRQLKDHRLVNNWSNGWTLRSNQGTNNEQTIVIFFLPQLWEWLGFILLPVPFVAGAMRGRRF